MIIRVCVRERERQDDKGEKSNLKHYYQAEIQWPVGILTKINFFYMIFFSFLCEDARLKFKIPTLVQDQQGAIW